MNDRPVGGVEIKIKTKTRPTQQTATKQQQQNKQQTTQQKQSKTPSKPPPLCSHSFMQKCFCCSNDEGWTCPYLEALVLGFKCHSLKVSATSFLGVQCLPDQMPVSGVCCKWDCVSLGSQLPGAAGCHVHGLLGCLTACTTSCIGE